MYRSTNKIYVSTTRAWGSEEGAWWTVVRFQKAKKGQKRKDNAVLTGGNTIVWSGLRVLLRPSIWLIIDYCTFYTSTIFGVNYGDLPWGLRQVHWQPSGFKNHFLSPLFYKLMYIQLPYRQNRPNGVGLIDNVEQNTLNNMSMWHNFIW